MNNDNKDLFYSILFLLCELDTGVADCSFLLVMLFLNAAVDVIRKLKPQTDVKTVKRTETQKDGC